MRTPAPTVTGPIGSIVARSALATAEIVGFSAYAHTRADGAVPPPDELLWISVGVFGVCLLMLSGRLRVRTVFAACTGLQVGLHVAYAVTAAPSMPGMHMGATVAPGYAMVVAHLLSAVVTALILLAQEQAVRTLGAVAALAGPVRPRHLPVRVCAGVADGRADLDILRIAPLRGPPPALPPVTS
ncbi:MAG TPA: hypothetical protein VF426_12950 [Marmoricola sp.]